MSYIVGVDIGGTFTDFVAYDRSAGTIRAWKTLSTPENPSAAVLNGLSSLGSLASVDYLKLGTTAATNALLESKGAQVAYVTTKGFRDVPFIQRGGRRSHYDLGWRKPKPLCLRQNSVEIDERITSDGSVIKELDLDSARLTLENLLSQGTIEAVAVNLLFSYANPAHEFALRTLLSDLAPDLPVSISYDVLPKWKEYERASTTIADAFIKPLITRQMTSMERRLKDEGFTGRFVVIRSNGGEMTADAASKLPVHLALSGPTGGVIASRVMAKLLDIENVVTLDMGGTSTDVATVIGGRERFTTEFQIEYGKPIQIPMIDIRTIGAGGGSIAWMDKAGMLHVGPQSAGANPGPACYGFGGTEATVTDANVVLGRISPSNFLGGGMRLDAEAAAQVVSNVADRIGLSLEDTALSIVRIANNNMVGALRAALIEEGLDPREFTLAAFGGAGPVHIADLMREANIPTGIVPNFPGQFSAYGFTLTDGRVDRHRSVPMLSRTFDTERANAVLRQLSDDCSDDLAGQGYGAGITVSNALEMRYFGQNHELDVEIGTQTFGPDTIDGLWEAFHRIHESRYGYRIPGEMIEVVNFKSTAIAQTDKPDIPRLPEADGPPEPVGTRWVTFDSRLETRIFNRSSLRAGHHIIGPAIIEESASVTPLPPGQTARVDAYGNLIISFSQS
ncbi:N-methylhydantoinase A [Rhodoligotrophos appendicifer]|uniref:hydantoinase/oxoprolinase family protein n=1 Tax=Rhodoligotrophos appendicifer TaxID=987056 RepID=UPI0011859341|nr:hydantoinase/oxoprolinase family protein [Rhodoligotrophos appendicifer]